MSISLIELEQVVREAGTIALTYFKDLKNVTIDKKSPRDFVTAADVAVEAFLKQTLTEKYPEYGFWGEESGKSANQTNRWIVDPIDGTHYYCAEQGKGAWKNGESIHVSDETSLANSMIATGFACLRSYLTDNNLERFGRVAQQTTGQRRFGSAAMDLCLVADGQVDAFWEQELNLYDVAAGALIAREAGATVTDFQGNAGIFPKHILATNGKILDQLLPLM